MSKGHWLLDAQAGPEGHKDTTQSCAVVVTFPGNLFRWDGCPMALAGKRAWAGMGQSLKAPASEEQSCWAAPALTPTPTGAFFQHP